MRDLVCGLASRLIEGAGAALVLAALGAAAALADGSVQVRGSEDADIETRFGVDGPVAAPVAARLAAGERTPLIVVLEGRDFEPDQLWRLGPAQLEARRARLAEATGRVVGRALGLQVAPEADLAGFRPPSEDAPAVYAQFSLFPGFAIFANAEEIAALRASPEIAAVYVDDVARTMSSTPVQRIRAPYVWDFGFEGEGRAVAVLDTGVEAEHPSTGPAITASACFNTTVTGQSMSLCPNGSDRQIDMTGGAAGDSCVEDEIDVHNGIDGCFHGTHVASVAAGRTVSIFGGDDVQGVARGASIIAVNVFSRFVPAECDDAGETNAPCVLSYTSDQLAALEWLFANRTALNLGVVNMSLGGGEHASACTDHPLRTAIANLKQAGIATVVSSGNDGFANAVNAPACIPEAITVGATLYDRDTVAEFSNSSELVDLLAPGVDIMGAYQSERPAAGDWCAVQNALPESDGFCHWFAAASGTSMAAPHVAGAFALFQSAFPSASVDEITEALQFSGSWSMDTRNDLSRSRISLQWAYHILADGGVVVDGVRMTPTEPFQASGMWWSAETFQSKTYTFTNQSGSRRSLWLLPPRWITASRSSFALEAGERADVTFSVNPSQLSGGGTGYSERGQYHIGLEMIWAPFAAQVERSEWGGEFGPFEWTGDAASTPRSIFRITGLTGGPPDRIDVALSNATAGTYQDSFADCSLAIRPGRYSGDEYLIISSDLADCGAFGRADLRFGVVAAPGDVTSEARMRRFTLNAEGGVSDLDFDRNARSAAPPAGSAAVPAQHHAGLTEEFFGPSDRAEPSVWAPRPPPASISAASGDAAAPPAALSSAEFGPFEWTGDATNETGSVFRIVGVGRALPTAIEVAVDHAAFAGFGAGFEDCSLAMRPERHGGTEYLILPADLADCGAFGRADLRFRITADAEDMAGGLSVRRYMVSADGGLTDVGFDAAGSALDRRLIDDRIRMGFGRFEWVGDANAPTRNVFRLVGIRGAPESISVGVHEASTPGYEGASTDCSLTIRPERVSGEEYTITNADLADCGDFGRANLSFSVVADPDLVDQGLRMRRLAVGAFSDLTDFGFDYRSGFTARRQPAGNEESYAEFGPYEWVGDGAAPTQSVFRLTGLSGGPPLAIDVAFDSSVETSAAFAGDFSDCALTPRPDRSGENEYIISSADLSACGDFGRGDVRFRIRAESDRFGWPVRMRRFAVTTTGGLTDFGFDNE